MRAANTAILVIYVIYVTFILFTVFVSKRFLESATTYTIISLHMKEWTQS
jgi:hypothetical protein